MTIDRIIMAFAGLVIITTSTLGYYHHAYWLFGTLFVGVNLFQSAFTGFCPLANILKALGAKPGKAFG